MCFMVSTGKGYEWVWKRNAIHFLWDKTEKSFNKAEGCSEMVKPPPSTDLIVQGLVCLGNCPGCPMWPGSGKDSPPEHWDPGAGALRNKISISSRFIIFIP